MREARNNVRSRFDPTAFITLTPTDFPLRTRYKVLAEAYNDGGVTEVKL